jgi:hypothetical protein
MCGRKIHALLTRLLEGSAEKIYLEVNFDTNPLRWIAQHLSRTGAQFRPQFHDPTLCAIHHMIYYRRGSHSRLFLGGIPYHATEGRTHVDQLPSWLRSNGASHHIVLLTQDFQARSMVLASLVSAMGSSIKSCPYVTAVCNFRGLWGGGGELRLHLPYDTQVKRLISFHSILPSGFVSSTRSQYRIGDRGASFLCISSCMRASSCHEVDFSNVNNSTCMIADMIRARFGGDRLVAYVRIIRGADGRSRGFW